MSHPLHCLCGPLPGLLAGRIMSELGLLLDHEATGRTLRLSRKKLTCTPDW